MMQHTKTTSHRPKATTELKDIEPLFLLLLRRFHVPAYVLSFSLNRQPERWNVVTMSSFQTVSKRLSLNSTRL